VYSPSPSRARAIETDSALLRLRQAGQLSELLQPREGAALFTETELESGLGDTEHDSLELALRDRRQRARGVVEAAAIQEV
jgi:hypothetical protein